MHAEPAHYNNMSSDVLPVEFSLAEFVSLEKIIRYGEQTNSPILLVRYLELSDMWANQWRVMK